MKDGISRRELIGAAGAAVAAGALYAQAPGPAGGKAVPCLFSKPLGNRKVSELPAVLKDLGVDAVDLTCRSGGHVLPERVVDDLPRAHELLKSAGISIPMITTEITEADKGNTEAIVKTAAGLGIRYAKVGYYPYSESGRVLAALAEAKAKLRDVAALFKQHGVRAGYHNHSGYRVGAAMWDVWQLIQDLPPDAVGSYFDVGHATVEGGGGGWRIGMNLLMPRMIMVAVKDFKWEKGKKDWQPEWGPMGEGMVRWKGAFTRLKQAGFAGPIALHVEYGNYGKAVGSDDDKATLANIRHDWGFLREQLAKAGM